MSLKTKLQLLGAEWHELRAKIEGHENALKEHLKSDWVDVRERYETAIEHFKHRLGGVEATLPAETLQQLKNGASVDHAVDIHLNPPSPEEVQAAVALPPQ